jgi:hypothetical protein
MTFGFRHFLDLTLFITFFLLSLFLIFSPTDVRSLKGRDKLGHEGILQMERLVTKCYRSSTLSLFPAFLNVETHAFLAGQCSV